MSSIADQYRAERAAQSGSLIYQQPAQRPAPRQIYSEAPPRTLAHYDQRTPASKYEPRPGESDHGYVSRLKPLLQHLTDSLPADELQRVAAAYNGTVQRLEGGVQSHADLRQHLTGKSGVDRGLFGTVTPQQRAAVAQPTRANSLSESAVAQQGHLQGASPTPGQVGVPRVYLSQVRTNEIPHRADDFLSNLGIRSSGDGWL